MWFRFPVEGMCLGCRLLPARGMWFVPACRRPQVNVRPRCFSLPASSLPPTASEKAAGNTSSGEDAPTQRRGEVSGLRARGTESLFCDREPLPAQLSACSVAATSWSRSPPWTLRGPLLRGDHAASALTACPQQGLPGLLAAPWGPSEQRWAFLLWNPHPGPIVRTRGAPTEAGSAR